MLCGFWLIELLLTQSLCNLLDMDQCLDMDEYLLVYAEGF